MEINKNEDIIARMTDEIMNVCGDHDKDHLERRRRKQERRERETSEERRERKLQSLKRRGEH